jgi:membrane dipeptidase
MRALNGNLAMVETYYRLGVRQMLIAYNLNNDAGVGG